MSERDGEGTATGIDAFAGPHAVWARIADLSAAREVEIMACPPGCGCPPEVIAGAPQQDLTLLRRGIALRSLHRHAARFHLPTRAYAETVLAEGAQIRTVAEIPGPMIVIDRRVAVLPHADPGNRAVIVREPSLLAYLGAAFEQYWALGSPFQTGPSAGPAATAEIKSAILMLLASGFRDDVIAQRLGLSMRACRALIADLMEGFGARSRFEAGVIAAKSGLLDPFAPN